jgi:HEAT repeat protein
VEIVPFSQKQIEQYIETWFRNAVGYLNNDAVSASSLIRELRNKPQIRGLAQNPLLLSLICSLYQEKGLTLPARRCQVYEQAVRYMVGKWSKNRNPELNDAWIDAKTELLEELAYQFSCDGKEIFTLRELRKTIDEYLRSGNASTDFDNLNASQLITELSEQDGILQKLHKDGDQYLFLHRTFQEYLTASYLNRSKDGIALAKEHFWEYDWHETLSLLAGLMGNPVPMLQTITDEKDDIFSTLLLLAGRCIAECSENPHPLIAEIIDAIYKFWHSYPNAGFIKSIVVAIGQVNSQMSQRLQKALDDSDTDVRGQAAIALGNIGNAQAVDALIAALNGSKSGVRRRAAEALAEIGSSQAVEALISAFNKNQDNYIGEDAAYALGQIVSSEALEAILSILDDERADPYFRASAAEALGNIGSSQAVEALISALEDDTSSLRDMVIYALGNTGSSQAIEPLILAVSHESSVTRQMAVMALGQIGNSQAVEALISALSDEDISVKGAAAEALERIGSVQAIEALISAFNNEDNWVRKEAVGTLGQHDSELEEVVSSLNNHRCSASKGAVVRAIGRLGNSQSFGALSKALKDSDHYVRSQAVLALAEIGSPLGIQALSTALQDSAHDIRLQAALSLAEMGSPLGMKFLSKALQDSDRDIRLKTAIFLRKITQTTTVKTLIKSHESEVSILLIRAFRQSRKLRQKVLLALEKVNIFYAIETSILALHDTDSGVSAISVLQRNSNSATLEKLLQLSKIDIYEPDIFSLARTLAVRFRKEKLPFIPVYPELVAHKQ